MTSTRLDQGTFLCSIDTEMAWGSAHRNMDPVDYYHWESYSRVRESVDKLLKLMDSYDIKATWAFVGRLLLDPRDSAALSRYPENPQPAAKYLSTERLSDSSFLDKWYAPELLNMILEASAGHEIGTHTFSHVLAGQPGYTRDLLRQDLESACEQASQLGIQLKSLIFPQNKVAHTDLLPGFGITSYRTVPERRLLSLPPIVKALAIRADAYLPVPPEISYAHRDGQLWVLPATYYHRHTGGWARFQSNKARRSKLVSGVRKAVKTRGLFHVWFHPYDIASDPDKLLDPLEAAFAEVASLREQGKIRNLTMAETSAALSGAITDQEPEKSPYKLTESVGN